METLINLELGTRVRVAGKGNAIYYVAEKSSPIRQDEWIVRKANGSMLSVKPTELKEIGN